MHCRTALLRLIQKLSNLMKNTTRTNLPVDIDRLVLLLNEAYVFLGMHHKALHPWRSALDEWQAKIEQETGWNHFAEVKKFEQNTEKALPFVRGAIKVATKKEVDDATCNKVIEYILQLVEKIEQDEAIKKEGVF